MPAACLGCRSKHLKCDGKTPCSRCVASESQCLYVASRRGYKGPRKAASSNPNKRQATSPPEQDGEAAAGCPMGGGFVVNPVNNGLESANPTDVQVYRTQDASSAQQPGSIRQTTTEVPLPERCLDAFYHYFHASHPFALPKSILLPLARDSPMEPLLAVMRWTGSLYLEKVDAQAKAALLEDARRLVDLPPVRDGFLLQALMVLIVALDGNCRQEEARGLLERAEQLALEIHLNTHAFATTYGRGLPVLEESWRRTWWDLFIIDGMIAGVHQATNFNLYDVPADVDLPCEELEYISGAIPHPRSLEELEDREFAGVDVEYSSFAYRILCGRTLGRFMRLSPIQGPNDENLNRIETDLTNWRLHLPKSKKDALRADGRPDEMMFQALMMLNATSLLLHQQHSQLDSSPAKTVTSCAPYRPVPSGEEAYNIHTHHTLIAANEISKLITHRTPLLTHTHFFTCVITLSSIVHLSRWAQHFYLASSSHALLLPTPYQQSLSQGVDDDLRGLIRLNIGALSELSSVWGAAGTARGQVSGVAQEIYRTKKQRQLNPTYWYGFSSQEVIESIAADDTIIGDIRSLQGVTGLPELLQ